MREERVEQSLRAPGVLAGEQRLLELRDDPDDPLAGDRVDESLDAPFELAHVDGPGAESCSSRLEDHHVVVDPLERGACQRGLPHAVLADEEHGARRGLCEGGHHDLDELSPTSDEQCRRLVERPLPDAPDVLQVATGAPRLEARAESRTELSLEAIDEGHERLGLVESDPVEGARVDDLATGRPVSDELRHDVVAQRLEHREHGPDGGSIRVDGQRSEQQPVLAERRANGTAHRPGHPLVGDVVSLRQRGERHGGHPAVGVSAQGHDLVDLRLGVRERGRAELERRQ